MCSFGLQFIFSFSTKPFYKNYWMLDSHTNTVFHNSCLPLKMASKTVMSFFQIYSVFMGLFYVLGFSTMDLEMSLAVRID